MYCKASVRIMGGDGGVGLGKGVILLMEGVEKHGSIRQATLDMNMAYSKAWKLLNTAEKELGVTLISRYFGTRSSLTAEGRRLLALYGDAMAAAQAAADGVFREFLTEARAGGNMEE